MKIALAGAVLFVALPLIGRANAQNVFVGHQIAVRWCASCHVVETGQARVPNEGIPSFFAVAQMGSTTQVSLTVFLESPHAPMPNFSLSRQEIADVSAYILSLSKQKQ